MKTISVSVDDETHRLARNQGRPYRDHRVGDDARPADGVAATSGGTEPAETEPEMRARRLDEVLGRFRREGIGVDTSRILTREERALWTRPTGTNGGSSA